MRQTIVPSSTDTFFLKVAPPGTSPQFRLLVKDVCIQDCAHRNEHGALWLAVIH